jgi:DNA-binding CsgD family transcriptional regulator
VSTMLEPAPSPRRTAHLAFATREPAFLADRSGTIRAWNPVCEQRTGIAASDAIGRSWCSLLPVRDDRSSVAIRALGAGWPPPATSIVLQAPGSPERHAFEMSSVLLDVPGDHLVLHLLLETSLGDDRQLARALTPRQREVLHLAASGLCARRIAEQLVLSQATVRHHIRDILRALDVHSLLEAVAVAHEHDL